MYSAHFYLIVRPLSIPLDSYPKFLLFLDEQLFYIFPIRTAAPPKSAPSPIAAVCTGPAAPAELELDGARVGIVETVVAAVTPDVKGMSVAELAPVKAGMVVEATGVAMVLLGFKTLVVY